MSGTFNGKVVLVTGAGRGIGFEIARQFYNEGATVYLNDIDEKQCIVAANVISKNGDRCVALPGDASNKHQIEKLFNNIIEVSSKIDIVIANAGITLFKSFIDITYAELSDIIDLNIKGTFMFLQGAAKRMIDLKTRGKLIAMSSITGHRAHRDLAGYGMTKAAIEALVRNIVPELSPFGITINAIAPGATMTERTASDEHYQQVWSQLTPLGRPSSTEDIAALTLFLASEKASQITGQTIVIDGGWSASSPGPEFVM